MCCGQDGQYTSAIETEAIIESYRRPGSTVVFTGDLNVFDGLENSKAIRYLKYEGPVPLEDTFRTANGDNSDGSTFGSAGKVDYVFTSPGTPVISAQIDRGHYGPASDHYPINAIIKI